MEALKDFRTNTNRLQRIAAGVLLFCAANALASVLYVDLNSTGPAPPYSSWLTAATNIQDAVNMASPGDQVVVTNGTYRKGGMVVTGIITNRVAVNKSIRLISVNGPEVTTIEGYQIPVDIVGSSAVRCVYLAAGASIVGFTLTNGATSDSTGDPALDQCGAGLLAEGFNSVVSNCVITGNWARGHGAGACGGTLVGCSIFGNFSDTADSAYRSVLTGCGITSNDGGGANNCKLTNCAVVYNSGKFGGAAFESILENCLVISNTASRDGGGVSTSTCYNCVIAGNSAGNGGGGAAYSTLYGCVLSNNAASVGGGAWRSTVDGCSLSWNHAWYSGGAGASTLRNCTISDNAADFEGGGVDDGVAVACTLVRNSAGTAGGGANNSYLTNCSVTSNSVSADGGQGGGAFLCTLSGCEIFRNSSELGAGCAASTLYGCTLVSNKASSAGGGLFDSVCTNTIIYFNEASSGANYYNASMAFCCTTPIPPDGANNITNSPQLFDISHDDFRLGAFSPCINSGNNVYVGVGNDLAGSPRVIGGTVDIGAREFQTPASVISYAWLQQYGLPTDGTADYKDLDGDGMNNWQEWKCQTNPLNESSVLRMLLLVVSSSQPGIVVTWTSVEGTSYFVQRSTNTALVSSFSTTQSNIIGKAQTTSFADTNAVGTSPLFFRVGVQ